MNEDIFSKAYSWNSSIYIYSFIGHHRLNVSLTDAPLALHIFSISHLSHNFMITMKMFLFLNEACIFIDSVCEGIVFWGLCLFVCAECENASYRGAEVPYKTLFRACDTSFFGIAECLNLVAIDPRSEAYC